MLILLGSFLALMLLGVPVALALAVSSLLFILVTGTVPDVIVAQRMIAGVESFPLLAVPFFILAGNLMNIAGVTGRIYAFAVALVGWMKGGLGQVNIIGSVIFSACRAPPSRTPRPRHDRDQGHEGPWLLDRVRGRGHGRLGDARADHPAVAALRHLRHDGERLDRRALLGGLIPGVVMTLMMMGPSPSSRTERLGLDTPFSWRQLGSASIEVRSCWPFPVAVWLMIRPGCRQRRHRHRARRPARADWYFDFSAVWPDGAGDPHRRHDHGAVHADRGAVAAVLWSLFSARALPLDDRAGAGQATFDTIETTPRCSSSSPPPRSSRGSSRVSQAAQILSDAVLSITQNKWVFLLLANLLMLFVGCFLDTIAAITILVPILLPIALKLGIDPIHFGLIVTLNLMIGLLHPPLGMVLFVLARVANLSVERTTVAILPWLVPLLAALVAITYIPELTLWLPRQMGLGR
jgi:hypothetical protein